MEMGRLNLNNDYEEDVREENSGDLSFQDDFMEENDGSSHIVLDEKSYTSDNENDSAEGTSDFTESSEQLENTVQQQDVNVYDNNEKITHTEGEVIDAEEEITATEYVKVEASEVIGGAYTRETYNAANPRKHTEMTMKNITVTTQYVAKALNVTEQTVRNYCKELSGYFNIEITGSGRMRFTQKDIDDLRYVMKLKEMNNFTMEQLRQYLLEGSYASLPETKRLDAYAQNLEEKVLQLIADKLNTTTLLLQEQNDTRKEESENIQRILLAFEQQSKDIEELKQNITEINEKSKQIDIVDTKKDDAEKELEKFKSEIESLRQKNEKLMIDNANMSEKVKMHEQTITELSQRKERKKFLGIF